MKDDPVAFASTSTKTPNFLIIGAAKSGTTAVWHYLKQHPQIFMSPRKHTRFFAYEVENPSFRGPGPTNPTLPYAVAQPEAYHALFNDVTDEVAVGEVSHSYLYRPDAPERIHRYAPDMKMVAILRNPAERAYSHHQQMVRNGREQITDFVLALAEEEARIRDAWWPEFHYVKVGLYHAQLRRYFDLFERNQVKVYLYEDLKYDPMGMLQDIFRFLGTDDSFVPKATIKYNAAGSPRNNTLHHALQELRRVRPAVERLLPNRHYQSLLRIGGALHNQNLAAKPLSPGVQRRVIDTYFREDIFELESLIERDLSSWLE